ncbi:MAG: PspC domain-containing protein [Micropruina sp.]|nr:PspC domain-containing protein [Micropruina sp.]
MRRAADGAVVGGVCAGLARRWQVDPTLLRIAVVLLSLVAGIGIAVYVGALLLIPREGASDMPVRTLIPATRRWSHASVIGAVVALGAVIIVLASGSSPLGIGPAIGLGFLWYFGFYRHQPRRTENTPTSTPSGAAELTPFERAAADWERRVAEQRHPSAQTASAATPQWPLSPAVPLRPTAASPAVHYSAAPQVPAVAPLQFFGAPAASTPSTDLPQLSAGGRPAAQVTPVIRQRARWIWPLTLGLIGAGLSGLALAESQGWIVPPVAYFSAALAAMAIGLVLSTWFGRPRGLLPTAILTGVATLVTLTPADRFVTGDYPRSEQLTFSSIEDLPQTREVNASATAIDLSTTPDHRRPDGQLRAERGHPAAHPSTDGECRDRL